MSADVRPDGISLLEVAVFLAELALLAALAVAGWRLGEGAISFVLAIAMPLAVAAIWSLCLAPNAVMRLTFLPRLLLKIDLFVAGAVLLALSGLLVVGIVFGVATLGLVVSAEVADDR